VNTRVTAEIFQHKEGIPDPKTHYLFPFHHALSLWQIVKYKKNFSALRAKPKEATSLCQVTTTV